MKYATTLFSFGLAAALAPSVLGHGYLASVTIDGKNFKGNIPGDTPKDSPIRQINDVSPVKGTDNPNLVCGQSAQPAKLVADAKPGSKVDFMWANGENGNWVHNIGPVITWMASCGDAGCKAFDGSGAKWFKIDQLGQTPGNLSEWGIQKMVDGTPLSVTVPSGIDSGEFMIRHELVMLHVATTEGGAEFYPGCVQLKITGGTAGATAAPTTPIPGQYTSTEPGILVPTIFDPVKDYKFPGPAIATLTGGAGSAGAGNNSTNDTDLNTSSAPTDEDKGADAVCRCRVQEEGS